MLGMGVSGAAVALAMRDAGLSEADVSLVVSGRQRELEAGTGTVHARGSGTV